VAQLAKRVRFIQPLDGDRQVGIKHEQAFTDRLYKIQWVDFAHGRFLSTFW
jgi:hypothetical protein